MMDAAVIHRHSRQDHERGRRGAGRSRHRAASHGPGGVQVGAESAVSDSPACRKGSESYERSNRRKTFPPTNWCASLFFPRAGRSSSSSAPCLTSITASRCRFSTWRRTSASFSITPAAASAPAPPATCGSRIRQGISEADDDELDRMDMAADQQLNSRLGCQAVITRPGELCGRDSQVEPQLRLRRQAAGAGGREVRSSTMPREILWTDAEEIGIQLEEKFPDAGSVDGALHRSAPLRDGAGRLRRRPGKVERVAARGHPDGVARGVPGRAGISLS